MKIFEMKLTDEEKKIVEAYRIADTKSVMCIKLALACYMEPITDKDGAIRLDVFRERRWEVFANDEVGEVNR